MPGFKKTSGSTPDLTSGTSTSSTPDLSYGATASVSTSDLTSGSEGFTSDLSPMEVSEPSQVPSASDLTQGSKKTKSKWKFNVPKFFKTSASKSTSDLIEAAEIGATIATPIEPTMKITTLKDTQERFFELTVKHSQLKMAVTTQALVVDSKIRGRVQSSVTENPTRHPIDPELLILVLQPKPDEEKSENERKCDYEIVNAMITKKIVKLEEIHEKLLRQRYELNL